MQTNDKNALAQIARRANSQAVISAALYDYLDCMKERKEDIISNNPNSTTSEIDQRIKGTTNVIAVFEKYKGWDFGTLFTRMACETASLNQEDQQRFDGAAIKIGLQTSSNESFPSTKKALKQIVDKIWQSAIHCEDKETKKELIMAAKTINNYKGNNLGVLEELYSRREAFLISEDLSGNHAPHRTLAFSIVNKAISETPLNHHEYQSFEQTEWGRIKNSSAIKGRNLADYKAAEQAECRQMISTTLLEDLKSHDSISSLNDEERESYLAGITQIQKGITLPTQRDMQSTLDVLSFAAYRTNDKFKQKGMLAAIDVASEHIIDVSIGKTKTLLHSIADQLVMNEAPSNEKDFIANMLYQHKGNDIKALMNKLVTISIPYHNKDADPDSMRRLKKASGYCYLALMQHSIDVKKGFDQLASSEPYC